MRKWPAVICLLLFGTTLLMFNAIITDGPIKKGLHNCRGSVLVDKNVKFEESYIFLDVFNVGCVAVNVRVPNVPRWKESSPQILMTPVFFTPSSYSKKYENDNPEIFSLGAIEYNLILPSRCVFINTFTGASIEICSDGSRDAGGKESQQSMHAVLKYMSGDKVDSDNEVVTEKFPTADDENVGAFAFSHPGFLLNTTMANWGSYLDGVSYVVMRENPTQSLFGSVELGDVDSGYGCNPLYSYSKYDSDFIKLDYSSISWREVIRYLILTSMVIIAITLNSTSHWDLVFHN